MAEIAMACSSPTAVRGSVVGVDVLDDALREFAREALTPQTRTTIA
jgi:hypothetical protein